MTDEIIQKFLDAYLGAIFDTYAEELAKMMIKDCSAFEVKEIENGFFIHPSADVGGARVMPDEPFVAGVSKEFAGCVLTYVILSLFNENKAEFIASGLDKISDEEAAKRRAQSSDIEGYLKANAKSFAQKDFDALISAIDEYVSANFDDVQKEKWDKLLK